MARLATPLAGCFSSWKSQSKMDENWGYPYDSGNLHGQTHGDFQQFTPLPETGPVEVLWKASEALLQRQKCMATWF